MTQFATMDALVGLRLRVTQNHNDNDNDNDNDKLHITTGYACGIDTYGCLQLRQDNGKLIALLLVVLTLLMILKRHIQRALI